MNFGAPWALFGLLALPLIWWLHRRLRRPPDVALPSLMFLQDEEEASALPRARVLDAELLLAMTAAALLALAAAGPRIVHAPAHRVVSVTVSGGTAATARGYAERVEAVLADVRAGLDPQDVLRVRYEPSRPVAGEFAPRPTADALLAAARAGLASLRVVVSDSAPPSEIGDVYWVSVGEPAATNTGLVAASVQAGEDFSEVFFALAHHGARGARRRVFVRGRGEGGEERHTGVALVDVPAGGMASGTVSLAGRPAQIEIVLTDDAGEALADDLHADDRVELTRAQIRVYVHDGLPAAHRERIGQALEAVLGPQGVVVLNRSQALDAELAFVPVWSPLPSDAWILALRPIADGDAVEHARGRHNPRGRDPVVRDLSAAGVDWVYAEGALAVQPGEDVLLQTRGAEDWPVVLRDRRRVRLAADPLRGEPAAVDTPFWPLLIENLVHVAGGHAGAGAGYRSRGLLDADTSRPGRARIPFDPRRLAAAAPVTGARARSLRGPLILGALACLLMLWGAPRVRRRLTRPSAANVQAQVS